MQHRNRTNRVHVRRNQPSQHPNMQVSSPTNFRRIRRRYKHTHRRLFHRLPPKKHQGHPSMQHTRRSMLTKHKPGPSSKSEQHPKYRTISTTPLTRTNQKRQTKPQRNQKSNPRRNLTNTKTYKQNMPQSTKAGNKQPRGTAKTNRQTSQTSGTRSVVPSVRSSKIP